MKTVRATRGDFVRDIEVWSDDIGVRLASFDGPAASYQAPEDLLYVRARAVKLDDDGNPRFFADPNGHSGVQRNVVVQGNAAYGSGSGFITNPSGCVAKYGNPMYNATDAEIGTFRKGGKQIIDGLVIFAGFHTIFAPNGVSCADSFRENYTWRPLYYGWVTTPSASSYHSGGVNCGMGDGSELRGKTPAELAEMGRKSKDEVAAAYDAARVLPVEYDLPSTSPVTVEVGPSIHEATIEIR